MIDKTDGNDLLLCEWARRKHQNPDSPPASQEQYRFLAGTLDKICDNGPRGHKAILHLFCGRPVSGVNPPSMQLAGGLLDYLLETHTVNEIKVQNPKYRPDIVQSIKRLWLLCQELEGQMKLPLES